MSKSKKPNKTAPATQKEKRALAKEMLLHEPAFSNRYIAKNCHISHTTVATIRAELVESGRIGHTRSNAEWLQHEYLKSNPNLLVNRNIKFLRALKAPGVLDMMQARGILSPVYAQRIIHHANKKAAEAVYTPLTAADITIKQGDVFDGLHWIKSQSVHAIICDPLYHRQHIPQYKAIAELAARVLVPQGLLIVMTGQSHLNKIMKTIDEVDGLIYNWTLSYLTMSGGSTYLNQIGVSPYWKPILLYIKGRRNWENRHIFSDIIDTKPDKTRQELHMYQQDIQGFVEIVRRFTNAGDIVLDPCCGSSTTGAACVLLGRKYIGVDIDPESVRVSKERLLALLTNPEPPQ